jgi:PhnB protein
MALNTYLTFEDNCREAFEFYRSIFGGEFAFISTFREGPEEMKEMEIPEEELDRIMHVSLPIGSSVLMGSDSCSSFGPPPVVGNNVSLTFEAEGKEHADEIFAKLSDGGEVKCSMGDAFWGAYYGACTDKFGINWQVIAEQSQD